MDILREINEDSTMKDMVENLIHNIRFYVQNREELADIKLTDEYLSRYVVDLEEILVMYENNTIPEWFKSFKPYKFTSANFPYNNPKFPWLFSFRDYVTVALSHKGEIIDTASINIDGVLYSKEEWKEKFIVVPA